MKFDFKEVPISEVRHWFTECWFYVPDLKAPIYVSEVGTRSGSSYVIGTDLIGRAKRIPAEKLDIRVPQMGYTSFTRDNRNTVWYLYNIGERSYKKGLSTKRVFRRHQTALEYDYMKWEVRTRNEGVGRTFMPGGNASAVESAFSPVYHSADEAVELLRDGLHEAVALSRDFALQTSRVAIHKGFDYELAYRGVSVAPFREGSAHLPEKLNFLHQRIQEEVKNVHIVGL